MPWSRLRRALGRGLRGSEQPQGAPSCFPPARSASLGRDLPRAQEGAPLARGRRRETLVSPARHVGNCSLGPGLPAALLPLRSGLHRARTGPFHHARQWVGTNSPNGSLRRRESPVRWCGGVCKVPASASYRALLCRKGASRSNPLCPTRGNGTA